MLFLMLTMQWLVLLVKLLVILPLYLCGLQQMQLQQLQQEFILHIPQAHLMVLLTALESMPHFLDKESK